MTTRLWTLGEWTALPEDTSCRFELEDGVMLVGPNPGPRHQFVATKLALALQEQLPEPWEVLPAVEVITRPAFPACVRVPDIVVVDGNAIDWNAEQLAAADVLVAIEIMEPGTREADTGRKRLEYAEAGIRHYWMVVPTPPVSLTVGSSSATGRVVLDLPFPIELDLTELTSRRRRTERMMNR
ncbi:Uma2 family endonuclease [Kutzneria buriramensis]|uniref:Uma2 family endonuclease n=1 Tax=Kutzneria buriramensis TaxID=1045776 RepID=A0A3E0GXF8_9PSEU|nr:Uma2 family endonuclease [Kutzneria buriramensis]REH32532.1 Uma2 family endonuclease [Kutzneria buriramensis]